MARYRVITDQGAYEVTTDEPDSLGEMIGKVAGDVFTKPASAIADLGTNPESMANAMPPVLGTAGAVSPIPGGATMGTATGQGLRDLALKTLGKPIPSGLQHGLELGGAALGDVTAIPGIKANIFGNQIGDAEKATGIVTRGATKAVTPGNVGQTLNDLEAQVDSGVINTAQGARDAKEVVDQIYGNPHIYEKSPGIQVQSARLSGKVQNLLNTLTPGRAEAASDYATSQTIPNAIGSIYHSIPPVVKKGLGFGLGISGIDRLLQSLSGKK